MATAPSGSCLPIRVQAYVGSGGPTASQRNVTSRPNDVDTSVGVTVNSGGPKINAIHAQCRYDVGEQHHEYH